LCYTPVSAFDRGPAGAGEHPERHPDQFRDSRRSLRTDLTTAQHPSKLKKQAEKSACFFNGQIIAFL
jgi:hypothetical protein